MYEEYIDRFTQSEEMREYLKTVKLVSWQIVELIYYSPCPLTEKLEGFRGLLKQAEDQRQRKLVEEIKNCITNIEDAFKLIDIEGVFTIERGFFDDDTLDTNSSFEWLCASFNDVMEYIKSESEDDQLDELKWYDVGKWVKDENGKYDEVCSYIIVREKIWYSTLYEDFFGNHAEETGLSMTDLNLPVFFKPGDIIEVDGFPFGPKFHMLILLVGDNWDCCCIQGLAKNKEGKWEVGAVKHGAVGYRNYPQISPLYTAKIYNGELSEDEKILYEVKEYVMGDEEKARYLYDTYFYIDEKTEEEIREFLADDRNFDREQGTDI